MKAIGLGIAFLLEIIVFISFASLGLLLDTSNVIHIVSFVILFIALVTFWGLFMAPRAIKKFAPPAYYVSKLIIYSLSAVVIFTKEGLAFGLVFTAAAVIDEALLYKHNLSSQSHLKN